MEIYILEKDQIIMDRLKQLRQQIVNIVSDCNKAELELLMDFINSDFGRIKFITDEIHQGIDPQLDIGYLDSLPIEILSLPSYLTRRETQKPD